jgi:hypothetical protein
MHVPVLLHLHPASAPKKHELSPNSEEEALKMDEALASHNNSKLDITICSETNYNFEECGSLAT